jgi:hypothetical protein
MTSGVGVIAMRTSGGKLFSLNPRGVAEVDAKSWPSFISLSMDCDWMEMEQMTRDAFYILQIIFHEVKLHVNILTTQSISHTKTNLDPWGNPDSPIG